VPPGEYDGIICVALELLYRLIIHIGDSDVILLHIYASRFSRHFVGKTLRNVGDCDTP